jgi:hypothetical protein
MRPLIPMSHLTAAPNPERQLPEVLMLCGDGI